MERWVVGGGDTVKIKLKDRLLGSDYALWNDLQFMKE